MGLPTGVGTSVTGSLVVDAASYVWSQWAQVSSFGQLAETWRLTNLVNTACYWQMAVAVESTGTTIVASGALNAAGNQIANALYAFDVEARKENAAGLTLYYNFRPSATTTVRQFWVTASRSEANI